MSGAFIELSKLVSDGSNISAQKIFSSDGFPSFSKRKPDRRVEGSTRQHLSYFLKFVSRRRIDFTVWRVRYIFEVQYGQSPVGGYQKAVI
jgi:hypothetical protein